MTGTAVKQKERTLSLSSNRNMSNSKRRLIERLPSMGRLFVSVLFPLIVIANFFVTVAVVSKNMNRDTNVPVGGKESKSAVRSSSVLKEAVGSDIPQQQRKLRKTASSNKAKGTQPESSKKEEPTEETAATTVGTRVEVRTWPPLPPKPRKNPDVKTQSLSSYYEAILEEKRKADKTKEGTDEDKSLLQFLFGL